MRGPELMDIIGKLEAAGLERAHDIVMRHCPRRRPATPYLVVIEALALAHRDHPAFLAEVADLPPAAPAGEWWLHALRYYLFGFS